MHQASSKHSSYYLTIHKSLLSLVAQNPAHSTPLGTTGQLTLPPGLPLSRETQEMAGQIRRTADCQLRFVFLTQYSCCHFASRTKVTVDTAIQPCRSCHLEILTSMAFEGIGDAPPEFQASSEGMKNDQALRRLCLRKGGVPALRWLWSVEQRWAERTGLTLPVQVSYQMLLDDFCWLWKF